MQQSYDPYPGSRAIPPAGYSRTETSKVEYQEVPQQPVAKKINGEKVPEDIELEPHGSRIGDKHRDRAVDHLTTMHGHGFITAEELEIRRTHVMAATRAAQLAVLTDDLPPMPVPRGPLYDSSKEEFTMPGWVKAAGKLLAAPWKHNWFVLTVMWLVSLTFLLVPIPLLLVGVRHPSAALIAAAIIPSVLGAVGVLFSIAATIEEVG